MLRAEGLARAFGSVVALDDISFHLTAGQRLAIFGPNGAGKTTLLKVLAGAIRPERGRAVVDGGRRAVGWIGHQSHLYGHLSVRENLYFWASLYGVARTERGPRAAALVARLGLGDWADRPARFLSRGLMQRAAIARALIHDPNVLLMDEPFTGLDLDAAEALAALLAAWSGPGRVLVLATHNVDEGAALATDVAFQRRGRFVYLAPRGARGPTEIAALYRQAVADA